MNQLQDGSLPISNGEFETLQKLIHQQLGIYLTEKKRGLLVSRLSKHLKSSGITSYSHYIDVLKRDHTGQEIGNLADLISTNHTFFFREMGHFDFMNSVALPHICSQLKSENNLDLRIWCAAASSGEEPYSIMMTLKEYLKHEYNSWDAGLLATDISMSILETAKQGIYPEESVSKIPLAMRHRYFNKRKDNLWEIKPDVRNEITFRRFNLIQPQLPFKKPFQIIFCRNVMIYFDNPTIQKLIHRFYDILIPGGYLFVGYSESLGRVNNPFNYLQPAIYQKPK